MPLSPTVVPVVSAMVTSPASLVVPVPTDAPFSITSAFVFGGAFRIMTVWAEATPTPRVVISAAATASSRGGFDIRVDLTSRMRTDIENEKCASGRAAVRRLHLSTQS